MNESEPKGPFKSLMFYWSDKILLNFFFGIICNVIVYILADQLSDDVDLTGLDILESDIKEVQRRRVQVREESKQLLASGLEDLNREKVRLKFWKPLTM